MLVRAYAKINLGIHIVRKREDGFHELRTIFHCVNISDEIIFSKIDRGISLHTNLPYIPTDKRNLCFRAAELILQETGYRQGIHMQLQKNIPVGAGLGGGSADAAAVLLHLPDFLDTKIELNRRKLFAESLGSDVPFFLESKSAYATGRGEVLDYFDLALPYWIAVVYPDLHVSTPWAYSHLQLNPNLPMFDMKEFVLSNLHQPVELVNKLRNDFEPAVFSSFPEVMRTKELLYRTGADFALMSGSGSCVFGLYKNEYDVREAEKFISKTYPLFITPPRWEPS